MNDNKISKNSIVAKFAVPISFLILFFLAANFTDCDLITFWKRRSHLTDLVVDMIPPDFSYIQKILLPLFYTIQMSVTGTVLGTFFALVLSPFGAANLEFPAVMRRILRIVIQILRSFPALILALTATFLFGLGTFAGTFAITLYTFAIMTKLTYEDASAADVKAYQALRAMGVSKYVAYIHGILPEIIPGFLTNALYLLETNVRHSSILGYVGAGGIGLLLNEKISWLEYDKVGTILLMLFLTVCVIEYFSRYLAALIRKERTIKKEQARLLLLFLAALILICTLPFPCRIFPEPVHRLCEICLLAFCSQTGASFSRLKKMGLGIFYWKQCALLLLER